MAGRLEYPDFKTQVALGLVPGVNSFRKFGYNSDVDSGLEDIWQNGGVRVLPSAASVVTVVSTSIEDDVGGTGISEVVVQGLDSNYLEISEPVTLNGTGSVTTTQSFLRINRCFGTIAGTNQVAVGNISFTVDGSVQSLIAIGRGQTLLCMYTVPANKTLIVDSVRFSVGRITSGDMELNFMIKKNPDNVWRSIITENVYQASVPVDDIRTIVESKTDFRVQATSTVNNIAVSASVKGLEFTNNYKSVL